MDVVSNPKQSSQVCGLWGFMEVAFHHILHSYNLRAKPCEFTVIKLMLLPLINTWCCDLVPWVVKREQSSYCALLWIAKAWPCTGQHWRMGSASGAEEELHWAQGISAGLKWSTCSAALRGWNILDLHKSEVPVSHPSALQEPVLAPLAFIFCSVLWSSELPWMQPRGCSVSQSSSAGHAEAGEVHI